MDILEIIEKVVFNGKTNVVILEAGSNDCQSTVKITDILKRLGINYTYHAFEMVENLFEGAVTKMAADPDVKLYKYAISDKSEKDKAFYRSSHSNFNGSSSILAPKLVIEFWPEQTFEKEICDTISIDDFCQQKGITHIDFIWADIQGAEHLMIAGAKGMLSEIDFIYTEYSPQHYEGSVGLKELCAMLPDFDVYHDFGGDVLFVNKNKFWNK
jgi:FkbM family methyltransferase